MVHHILQIIVCLLFLNKFLHLKEVNIMVCIPSIVHQKASPKVYKTPHHPHFIKGGNIEIWKIALATSAAPTYLSAAVIDDNECKIDGGLWANNPVLVAIAEAVKLGYSLEQIKVLSIGTRTSLSF
ncbi:patatin-like phospholipase family protein [Bacillus thuringiensis]|uniref:patatin-like phospholipase family protein n=3 Tax=Bacillus cereus group TaxID=86661 RepID=UPI000BFD4C69|nr:patatin-like phospholipase family protein [Bacillus thuringiensis]PGP46642.1 patatin [Bacillus thuringiensis]PGY48064.1 patatin [Bacillus thuringiensis]